MTRVSEQSEVRRTKKLSKECNRMESCFLGALSQFDEFRQKLKCSQITKYYITQVSVETEIRVTKKLSKEFNRWESPILDEVLLISLIQGHSGTAPETYRKTLGTNQGTNEDESQSVPHSGAIVSQSQRTRNSGPGKAYDMVKSVPEESPTAHLQRF